MTLVSSFPTRSAAPVRRLVSTLPVLAIAAALGAQADESKAPAPDPAKAPISLDARKAAKKVFTTYCATCHGATGKGDGLAAAGLNPKPRTLIDMKWQKSVSDDHIAKVILEGGASVKLSPQMAPAKAMFDNEPEGTIDAMVEYVRKLAKPEAPSMKARAAAKKVFTTYCATCHGATGKGDGLAAAALNPKPRTLIDMKWQRSVSDDHIAKVILEGGAAVKLSPQMAPAKAMLATEPEGTIDAMVEYIRKLGAKESKKAAAKPAPEKK